MIPVNLKVAGINYDIEYKKHVLINGEANYSGSCDGSYHKIELKKNLPKQSKEDTFVHELTHAIFFEAGYNEHDEEMITRIGKVLYQVLKDNEFKIGK